MDSTTWKNQYGTSKWYCGSCQSIPTKDMLMFTYSLWFLVFLMRLTFGIGLTIRVTRMIDISNKMKEKHIDESCTPKKSMFFFR